MIHWSSPSLPSWCTRRACGIPSTTGRERPVSALNTQAGDRETELDHCCWQLVIFTATSFTAQQASANSYTHDPRNLHCQDSGIHRWRCTGSNSWKFRHVYAVVLYGQVSSQTSTKTLSPSIPWISSQLWNCLTAKWWVCYVALWRTS